MLTLYFRGPYSAFFSPNVLVVSRRLNVSKSLNDSSTLASPDDKFVITAELQDLLDRWESLAADGASVTAEELCDGDPKLSKQLREYINWLDLKSGFDLAPSHVLPDKIGPYRIVSEIDRGGYSVVYLAEQEFPSRKVALKLLHDVAARPDVESRFRLEVQLLALLRHNNIAKIFDAGVADVFGSQRLFFTMEWIQGRDVLEYVQQKLAHSNWGHRDTIKLFLDFTDALAHAHAEGIVHRDLKPGNLLVTTDGDPKLIDFGLARVRVEQDDDQSNDSTKESWTGTRCYMSPEQFGGDPARIDSRTDIYACGVVLYQLLAGQLPYQLDNRTMWETAQVVKQVAPEPIGRVDSKLRGDVEVILETTLAKEPEQRYASVEDFAEDLRRYLEGRPILARRQGAAVTLWKWCQRHRRAAILSTVAMMILVTLSIATGLAAKLAVDRAEKLDHSNKQLKIKQQQLIDSNQRYADSGQRLRRTAFNQSLLRLSMLAASESASVAEQLDDDAICPPDLRGFAWNVLRQSAQRTVAGWYVDDRGLLDVAISDDGTWIVTSGPSGVRVWDVATREKIAAFSERTDSPKVRLAIDSESKTVLFSREDGKPGRLDVTTNVKTALVRASNEKTTALAPIPGSGAYLIADESGVVACFETESGQLRWSRQIGQSPVIGLTVSKRGDRFGAVSRQGELLIGDLQTGELQIEYRTFGSGQKKVAWIRGKFSSDLGWACLCTNNNRAMVWDMASGQAGQVWDHRRFFPDLDFVQPIRGAGIPPGSARPWVVTSGRGQVDLWGRDGELATLFRRDCIENIVVGLRADNTTDVHRDPVAIDVSQDGKRVVIGVRGGHVIVVNTQPKPLYREWQLDRPTVSQLRISDDGKWLAASSGRGGLILHDMASGEIVRQWSSQRRLVGDILFTRSSRFLITREKGQSVSLWDTANGKLVSTTKIPTSTKQPVYFQDRLLVGFQSGNPVWLRMVEKDGQLHFAGEFTKVESGIAVSAYDKSSSYVATADGSGRVTLRQISKGGQFRILAQQPMGDIREMRFLPDGKALITGLRDGTVAVWSTPDLERQVRRRPNSNPLGGLALSADGRVMVTGHTDGEVLFWDTTTWDLQLSVQTEISPIRDVRFSPDGDRLVVGGKGDKLLVFDAFR